MHFVLALVLAASPPPLEQAGRIQPIGWTADQKRVALRVFFGSEHSEAEDCPGYIDAEGKKFRTGLALVVLKEGAVEHSFVIQRPSSERCTPTAEAKSALEAAKKKLEELGIDRAAAGRALTVKRDGAKKKGKADVFRAVDADRTVLELSLTVSERGDDGDDARSITSKGTWTRPGVDGGAATGTFTLPPTTYSLIMAGSFRYDFTVLAAPSGERLLVFAHERHANMRGEWQTTRLLDLR
jgi:hypothetical protein